MSQYSVINSQSGAKTLVYKDGNKTIRIHSAYDPIKEAARSVNEFTCNRASIIIVCGLGLGYHIQLLHNKYPQLSILVIEKDKELTSLVYAHNKDIHSLCTIVNTEEEIASYIDSIDLRYFKGTSIYIHRPSYTISPRFYESMLGYFHKHLSSKISDQLTRFEFEELWIKNILINTTQMDMAYPVKLLFGKFIGIPGIIVSAGPSLIHALEALKNAYNKALIVCVDTAYKVLHRHGIRPHIVMTLDAQTHSVKHFLGIPTETLIIADVVSCPKVTRRMTKKFFSTTAKYFTGHDGSIQRESTPLMDWIQAHTGDIGDIQSGGSVATSAFDLLLNAGCSCIVLVGQDLAYTGREIHSRGTHHNDDWLPTVNRFRNLDSINQNIIRKRKIKYVASNNGGTVITDFVLDLYRRWFEDSAKKVPIPVYNTSAEGAVIAHTHFASLDSLVASWQTPSYTPEQILSQLLSNNTPITTQRLKNKIALLIDTLYKIDSASKQNDSQKVFTLIDNEDCDAIFSPLLRKTMFYIARHNMDDNKRTELLTSAIANATKTLLKIFTCIFTE